MKWEAVQRLGTGTADTVPAINKRQDNAKALSCLLFIHIRTVPARMLRRC